MKTIGQFLSIFTVFACLSFCGELYSADGDTLTIRTIEFGGKSGKYLFPPKGETFQKVIINYKIICPCAEWDYMAYVFANDLEIFRYITPYGNGLDVGPKGFNHQVDVTDFSEWLRDSVFIRSENTQEDVEITFDFIRGTPPRRIVEFQPLYRIEKSYNKDFEQHLPPIKKSFADNEKSARLKIIQSGHGWDNDDRCAEFCKKDGIVKLNGTERYRETIWRYDCGLNPIYPQGGSWLLNRSNWCPGAEVNYYDYELTPYLDFGSENEIDYDMEFYDEPITGDIPMWRIAAFLITYTAPNFQNDAAIYDILYPTKKDMFKRMQPVCSHAAVVLKNTGSDDLTKVLLKVAVNDLNEFEYEWNGTLRFLEMDTVYIPLPGNMNLSSENNKFHTEILAANDKEDDYASNNKAITYFDVTPKYHKELSLQLKTNNFANEQYVLTLKNASGDVLLKAENLLSNTLYDYPFNLDDGCYELRLVNKLGYGLDSWFLRSQLGTGYMSLYARGKLIKSFMSDFGSEIFHQFRVGEKPEIAVSTDSVWFGKQLINSTTIRTVEVEPKTSEPLFIREARILLGEMRGYYIESTDPLISDGGITLQPGQKLSINVRFTPTKAGNANTNLLIYSNDELMPNYPVKLSGFAGNADGVDIRYYSQSPILVVQPSIISDKAEIIFSTGSPNDNTRIYITDALGNIQKEIFSGAANADYNNLEFNCSSMSAGIYFIVLRTNLSSAVGRFVVVR